MGGVLRVFLSLYLVWTKPGEIIVVGVHGTLPDPARRLHPGGDSVRRWDRAPPAMARAAFVALLIFPPVSIVVTLLAVLQRYFG